MCKPRPLPFESFSSCCSINPSYRGPSLLTGRDAVNSCSFRGSFHETENVDDDYKETFAHKALMPSVRQSSLRSKTLETKSKICTKCLSGCDKTLEQTSLGSRVAFYRVPRNSGKSCMVQDSNGQYHQKTFFLVPSKGLSNRQNHNTKSLESRNTNLRLKQHADTTLLTRNEEYSSTLIKPSNANAKATSVLPKRFALITYPHCVCRKQQNTENISLTLPLLYRGATDEQIDPKISRFRSSHVHLSDTPENIRPLSKFFCALRNFFFPNSTNSQRSSDTRITRLKTAFKKTNDDRRQSSRSSFSSSTSYKESKLFCWTCFEMDGDDETLSSVDSESGSDDNDDPNDGDGDVDCDNDDFANQEDIEAIEYSSDGGGDGSDNSSCNNENESYWHDDLMNQESNNYGLNEFDDCEDDEIEIVRKAGFGFMEDRSLDDYDNHSTMDKTDWLYETCNLSCHEKEYEAELLGLTESCAPEDLVDHYLL